MNIDQLKAAAMKAIARPYSDELSDFNFEASPEVILALIQKLEEATKWTPVEQELPPFGERVLAYSPANKHQGKRYFVTSLHVYSGKKDMIWLDEDINQWATHWRPLPASPGEDAKAIRNEEK